MSCRGEGLGQDVVGRLALLKALAELARFGLQFLVAERGVGLVQALDRVGDGVYFLQFAFGIASEDLIQQSHWSFMPFPGALPCI